MQSPPKVLLIQAIGVLCLGLLLAPSMAAAQAVSPSDALKKRVQEFYSLLQRGRVSQAESYITPDTLEIFRTLSVNPFLGFEVDSIEIGADGKSADVLVQILYQPPMAPQPFKYPRKTAWRLEGDQWLQVVPELNEFQSQQPTAGKPGPEELRFAQKTANLGILRQGDKREARFSFTNVTDHPVTITSVDGSCPCLRLLTDKKTYAPGETGELVLEFDSQDYLRAYSQTVVVRTDPGNGRTELLVKADIQPRRRASPAPQETPPTSPTGGGQ
jgi:hypothetical protein